MKKFLTIAAGALGVVSFTTFAVAQTDGAQREMTSEEHQRMMSDDGMPGQGQQESGPKKHRKMMAMMERCEGMMAKMDKSASNSSQGSSEETSAEGKWAWRPDPKQGPGPRARLRPPIKVWVPAENNSN